MERLGSREGGEGQWMCPFSPWGWEQMLWEWMEGWLGVPTTWLSYSQKKCELRWSAARMGRGREGRGDRGGESLK